MPITTEEILLLVQARFHSLVGERVHIMTVRPEEGSGWVVFVEHGGVIWKQCVALDGTLGSCSRHYPQLETIKH
jgi:hypothetical protein